jgi:hypothetical protein
VRRRTPLNVNVTDARFVERHSYEHNVKRNQQMNSVSSLEKLDLMQMLRRQGEWDEACRLRDMIRLQARRAGYSRLEARNIAWSELEEAFPPRSAVDIATEPVLQWLARSTRPHSSFASIEPNMGPDDLSLVELWRMGCVAMSLHIATTKGFWLLMFKAYEAMVGIADDAPEDLNLRSHMAYALAQPLRFLEQVVLPQFETLLNTEDAVPEEAGKELRLLVEAFQQRTTSVSVD